jgi:hypothetical protein
MVLFGVQRGLSGGTGRWDNGPERPNKSGETVAADKVPSNKKVGVGPLLIPATFPVRSRVKTCGRTESSAEPECRPEPEKIQGAAQSETLGCTFGAGES